MTSLLVTGSAGFIGSHTTLALLEAGHDLVVLDNFPNSSYTSLRRMQEMAGLDAAGRLAVVEGDIRNHADLERAFAAAPGGQPIEAVIHLASLNAVGKSVQHPLRYWGVNLSRSRQLLAIIQNQGCRTLVFSSSARLCSVPKRVRILETAPIRPINPYGYSKVAVGRRQCLRVFDGDWTTPDGSGIGDYIHVMDLAEEHKAALDTPLAEDPQLLTLNLGSGQGHPMPYEVLAGRPDDSASTVADPFLSAQRLGWCTWRSLDEMCRDHWAWQSVNPHCYAKAEGGEW